MENQRPTVKLPQHHHCQVCGKAIRSKEEMCSEKCKKEWEDTVKRKRFQLLAWGLVMVVLVLISVMTWM